jgi:hypothetical protein
MRNANGDIQANFNVTVAGSSINVDICIFLPTFAVTMDFTSCGTPYTFKITKWSGRGMANFLNLFHEDYRDESNFGSVGENGSYSGGREEKARCVTNGKYCYICIVCINTR